MQADLVLAYRRYFPLLVQKCRRMLADVQEAEDLAQETFLRLCSADLAVSDARAVTSWLYQTSTRLAIDRLRARARHAFAAVPLESLAGPSSPEGDMALANLWAELVRRLPEDELQAGLLCHVDGLRQAEIAEVLGLSERSVRRLLASFAERAARLCARSER